MYPTPQPYAPAAPLPGPPPRHRRSPRGLLVFPLLFGFMFFGFSYFVSPEPDVEIQPGAGSAVVNGHAVVLTPYAKSGARGMFQVLTQGMFEVRLSAADPATGDTLWDTELSDKLAWEARVLAAGERYVYVATDSGLVILSLEDGSVVARDGGIAGLGGSFVATRRAYGYDAQNHRVMAMNADGTILAIPLDVLAAAKADESAASAWAGKLSAERSTGASTHTTDSKANLSGGGSVQLQDRPGGAPGSRLVRVTADGRTIPLGDTVFHRASLVVDGDTAAGSGHVLVTHQRTVNDTKTAVSAVSLETGEVTGKLDIGMSLIQATTLSGGRTAVVTSEVVVVLSTDGHLTTMKVGATDFFGDAF